MSTAKTGFAPIPDSIARMAAEAPGGQGAQPPARSEVPMQTAERSLFREREAFQKMSINMPKALYEELRAYMKVSDVPMTDVIVEATRRELIRLRKLGAEQ